MPGTITRSSSSGCTTFFGKCAQFRLRFEDLVRPLDQLAHVFEQEQFELVRLDDAPRHDDALAVRERLGERVPGADLAAGIHVPHHRLRGGVGGQRRELAADRAADLVLVLLGDAVLPGLFADGRLAGLRVGRRAIGVVSL